MRDRQAEKTPFGKSDGFRRLKLALKRLIGREPRLKTDVKLPLRRFGAWWVCTDLLSKGGVVYSLGVGEDIDLDLALISLKNMEVHAFDPTPNSVDWLEQQQLPAGFHFHPWAVGETDGSMFFYPRRLRDGSHSKTMYTLVADPATEQDRLEVPVKSINTITEKLGHTGINLLKMDIEGAEYDVLQGLLGSTLRPRQLLIEFHHRHSGLDKSQTVAAVNDLREAGYALADISSTGREFTFLLKSALGGTTGT
jgi:FkbM family methyltransferase